MHCKVGQILGFVFGLASGILHICNGFVSLIVIRPFHMKIVLVCDCKIPGSFYDDKERIVWYLGKALAANGHDISFLVRKESTCSFANVLIYNDKKAVS